MLGDTIDQDFMVEPVFGTDRFNPVDTNICAIKAMSELAMQSYSGRLPNKLFTYEECKGLAIKTEGLYSFLYLTVHRRLVADEQNDSA